MEGTAGTSDNQGTRLGLLVCQVETFTWRRNIEKEASDSRRATGGGLLISFLTRRMVRNSCVPQFQNVHCCSKGGPFLLVLLTASGTSRVRACSVDGDLIIVCNGSSCVRVMTGSTVGINEVVSMVKKILHHHPFAVDEGGMGLSREVGQPYLPQKIDGAGVAMAIRSKRDIA